MRHKTLALLLVVLLGLAGWALHQRFEFVTETVDVGASPLARRDPLLAARRYLERIGARVTARDHLPRGAELAAEGTLITGNAAEVLTAGQAQQLLDWAAEGGHLIVTAATHDSDRPDPLLAPFGVIRRAAGTPAPEPDVAKKLAELLDSASGTPATDDRRPAESEMTELVFEAHPEQARVHFDPRFILAEVAPDGERGDRRPRRIYSAGSAAGAHFAQYEWGDGLVSVLSDQRPWHNDRIGLHDHAYLLRILVDVDRPVLVLHGARVPNLLQLVATHGREALLAGALFVFAWLLRRARRFGPLRASDADGRRALGEHILASSRYRWRHGGAGALLRGARDTVLERARRRLPEQLHGAPQAQLQVLQEHTDLPQETLRQALHIDPGTDPAALHGSVASLQSLWKRL